MHDRGVDQCGIVVFLEDDEAPGRTRDARQAGVDLPVGGVDSLVRASVHYHNDESEAARFVGWWPDSYGRSTRVSISMARRASAGRSPWPGCVRTSAARSAPMST